MSPDARNTRASSDAKSKNGLGWRRLLHATIGELRWELQRVDRTMAALIRLADRREADGVIEMRPRIVAVKRTARSLKGR